MYQKFCYQASLVLLFGILSSGIPGNYIVNLLYPQPAWINIQTYAEHFHFVQMLPLYGGFIMMLGFVPLMAGIHVQAPREKKVLTLLAFGASLIYAAQISLNYALQFGVLQPYLGIKPVNESLDLLTFSNPHSVTMSIEMLGYAFQGAATWLVSSLFDSSVQGRITAIVGKLNGIVSVVGLLLHTIGVPISIDNIWGLSAFIGWNVLFTIQCLMYVLYFGKKVKSTNRPVPYAAIL